ncbi:MAG: CDP-diacylglycerol--serine O-phosphatidyltransferase [Myxococcales bacterium]|nr:CDP-diacylglycerol--serine O-phosphatidyltransferase [Myxococcales bacterium]
MTPFSRAKYLVPNAFTLGAALCGFVSVSISTQATTTDEFYRAAALIALAVFLDGFDGRVARMLNAQSKLGAQLDSLSDFLTFGVAPGLLIYSWGLRPLGAIGLFVAFVFAASAMIRLARFNVEAETHGGASRYFTGLPSPMGGLALALIVGVNAGVLDREGAGSEALGELAAFVVVVGLLMVSTVPFRTFKDLRPTWRVRILLATFVGLQILVGIRVDFMVALAMGMVAYIVFHVPSGVIGATRVVKVRAHRDGRAAALVSDDDDSGEFDAPEFDED